MNTLFKIILLLFAVAIAMHMSKEFGYKFGKDEMTSYANLPYFSNGAFLSPEPLPHYPERVSGGGGGSKKFFLSFLFPNPNAPKDKLPIVPLKKDSFDKIPSDLSAYWLGHSSLIIELEGKRFLIDPVFENAAPIPFVVGRHQPAPMGREELPPIDYVLITHDHYDHLEYGTIKYLSNSNARFIVPLGIGKHLEKWGVDGNFISELGWGDTFTEGGISVAVEPTLHYSGRLFSPSNQTLWACYALRGQNHSVFISGDSGYGDHFKDIGTKYGPFDMAFIEIDAWNPGWPKTHMYPEEALRAFRDVKAKALVPIHWAVFDLARHPWKESITMVKELVDKAGDILLLTPLIGQKLVPGVTETCPWWENLR
ncbi:MAG: MBL fold metallo-hydrolase [Puniceicoccales bacterium]|nr:MBL fold metallo-hydrolase [Puniceicoccales bacterium]